MYNGIDKNQSQGHISGWRPIIKVPVLPMQAKSPANPKVSSRIHAGSTTPAGSQNKDDRQIFGSLTSGGSRNHAVGSLDWPWSGSSRSSSSSSSGSIKVLHYSHGISMELEPKVMELFNGYGYICSKLRPIPWHNIFNKILKIESKISRQGKGNHPSNVETQEKSLTTLNKDCIIIIIDT